MTLMSLTAYAETHDVKKQSAAEWKARGYLIMDGTMVDAEASDRKMEEFGKGRFRWKAHGGRREKGVRGKVDRPAMDRRSDRAARANEPWQGWHPPENPNTLGSDLRKALAAGDEDAVEEALDTIQYSQWEDACTAAGWDRWPSDAAPALAAELGLKGREAEVRDAMHRLVRARFAALDVLEGELLDERLTPR